MKLLLALLTLAMMPVASAQKLAWTYEVPDELRIQRFMSDTAGGCLAVLSPPHGEFVPWRILWFTNKGKVRAEIVPPLDVYGNPPLPLMVGPTRFYIHFESDEGVNMLRCYSFKNGKLTHADIPTGTSESYTIRTGEPFDKTGFFTTTFLESNNVRINRYLHP